MTLTEQKKTQTLETPEV